MQKVKIVTEVSLLSFLSDGGDYLKQTRIVSQSSFITNKKQAMFEKLNYFKICNNK